MKYTIEWISNKLREQFLAKKLIKENKGNWLKDCTIHT